MSFEKIGGPTRNRAQMEAFKAGLDFCDLSDLGFHGAPWTWTDKSHDGVPTRVRLDWFVANPNRFDRFPAFRMCNIGGTCSDHLAILLVPKFVGFIKRRRQSFKFEAMWTCHPGCDETIADSWNVNGLGHTMSDMINCLARCGNRLH